MALTTTNPTGTSPEPTAAQLPPPDMERPAPMPPVSSLARVNASEDQFRMALEPTDLAGAMTLAKVAAHVHLCGVANAEEALIRMMTGRALGIPAFAALRSVYVINGTPSLEAKLKVGLCLRHPLCEVFEMVESTNEYAIYKAKRRGQGEKQLKFTVEDAQRAQLVKKDSNWEKWPAAMCRARASSQLADIVFPDATSGLPTHEEAWEKEEARTITMQPAPQELPQQAAPVRNLASEAETLKVRIEGVIRSRDGEGTKTVREEMKRFCADAGEPYASDVTKFYNEQIAAAKKAGPGPIPSANKQVAEQQAAAAQQAPQSSPGGSTTTSR